MSRRNELDRREFTVASALALLGGATITITGCGGGSSSSTTGSSGPVDVTGSITGNHGHRAVIAAAQLSAGGALHLDISGNAGHTHFVDLTASEVVAIRSGTAVAKDSTDMDAHRHTVSFVAPATGPGQGY